MALWFAASLLLCLISLAGARYVEGPAWVDCLMATGALAGLALALALGLALRRVMKPTSWLAAAALVLALAAALARSSLLAQLAHAPESALVTIDFPRMALACSTVVWGALALVWGALAVSDGWERARAAARHGGKRGRGWAIIAAAAVAVSLSLYSVAPLGSLLGVKLNHWTLLGLCGLAGLAYAIGQVTRRLKKKST